MVDVYYFTEMPYAEFPEHEADKFPSMRLTFPNTYFDPQKASHLFKRYLDEYQYAEEVGFDGLMINEHHNTPSCMDVEVNITGGILARITSRAKILMLGNLLPTTDNPVRLAEEVAMLDVISGGRIISGIVRGIGIESWATNTNPVYNRERFEESHDLMVKTWTTPGPFRWEGKHFHLQGGQSVDDAHTEAPSPDLDSRFRKPGDRGMGGCPWLYLCSIPDSLGCGSGPVPNVPHLFHKSWLHPHRG